MSNTCDDPDRLNASSIQTSSNAWKCLCQSVSHSCVVMPKEEIRWWNPNKYSVIMQSSTSSPELVEKFGMKVSNYI